MVDKTIDIKPSVPLKRATVCDKPFITLTPNPVLIQLWTYPLICPFDRGRLVYRYRLIRVPVDRAVRAGVLKAYNPKCGFIFWLTHEQPDKKYLH